MNNTEQFALLYGAPARHSDHQVGETITYYDAGQQSGRNSGKVLYIAAATAREPLRLICSPDIGIFPVEVSAADLIE